MKNTRTEYKDGITIQVRDIAGRGIKPVSIRPWDSGGGYDFFFPDGVISVDIWEMLAMLELYCRESRENVIGQE